MNRKCPPWCVADHAAEDERGLSRHRSETRAVPAIVEGRGNEGPHPVELLVEVSRLQGEAATWLYLGDGWTGFSMSLESAARLFEALRATLSDAGTLDDTGL